MPLRSAEPTEEELVIRAQRGDANAFGDLPVILGVGGILFAGVWVVWDFIDWRNDFYILTNQRVVWLERVIIFYYSRREAPLTHVLAVNVFSSWLGRIIGYGNVEVRTFTGSILMKNADPKFLGGIGILGPV